MASEAVKERLGGEPKDQHHPVAEHGPSSLAPPAPNVAVPVEDPARHDGDAAEPSSDNKSSPSENDNVDEGDDGDSAIDMQSYATSTYTVASDFDNVIEENGRTYHMFKDGRYMLPNDEIELNRLDMQNKMWSITLDDKLHLAPINPHLHNALDIGTGTGIWAIDFADQYPSARVIGTDLSLSQPQYVPVNCEFEIDDAEDEWIFPMKFDYIHGRALATCFVNPAAVIDKAYDALVPGGYLEFHDMILQTSDDGSIEDTALMEWQAHVAAAGIKMGRSWANVQYYKTWMIEKGFEDVTELRFRWPSNSLWPVDKKERLLGAWTQAQVDEGMLESVSTRLFMSMLGWSKEELTVLLAKVRRDLKDPKIKAYSPVVIVYGRKPLNT